MGVATQPWENLKREMRSRAVQDVVRGVKARARAYRKHPRMLGVLSDALIGARSRETIAIGEHLVDHGAHASRIGFGGEVPLINAKSVILLGRWKRRFEERPDLVDAEAA